MRSILFLLIIIACIGCTTIYQSRSELPTDLLAKAEEVEKGYLNTAKKKASFSTQCELSEIKAEVIEYGGGVYTLPGKGKIYVQNDQIKSIGVDACGTRATYIVFCGYLVRYSGALYGFATCDVHQEGSSALVDARNESEARKKNQAAASQMQ